MRKTALYVSKNPFLIFILFFAFVFHMMIVFPSGSYYCFQEKCGYFFWGSHGHDSIWHVALAENAFKTLPFTLPIFSGALLNGYNILLDIIIFLFSKIGIPPLISFFKVIPLFWFILFTHASIVIARKIINNSLFIGLLLFFFFFGGSFGYLLTLYHNHTLNGSESLLAMQSGHTLLNVQYGFSLLIILYILMILLDKKISSRKIIILGILVFLNFGMKFYAGIISLLLIGSFFLKKSTKIKTLIFPSIVCGIGTVMALFIFYDPITALSHTSLFIFSPFAHVHSMIEEPSLFYLKNMTNARYTLQKNGFGPRLFAIEVFSLLLYLFFNLGTRFFGLFYALFLLLKRKLLKIDVSILFTIIGSIILTTLFIQRGVWWNTVQFFYYSLFLSNIYIARFVYKLLTKNRAGLFFGILIILLTIPISFDFIREFSHFPSPAYLPEAELSALKFLQKQPDGIVLTSLYDKNISYKWDDPKPLFAYADTAYVSAFSHKKVYMADINQLELLSINYHDRLQEENIWDCELIKKINYIYEVHAIMQKKDFHSCASRLRAIFKNADITIYRRL